MTENVNARYTAKELKPFVLLNDEGRVYDVIKTNKKAAEKSLEMGVLWLVHPTTGSVVERVPVLSLHALVDRGSWYEARISQQKALPNNPIPTRLAADENIPQDAKQSKVSSDVGNKSFNTYFAVLTKLEKLIDNKAAIIESPKASDRLAKDELAASTDGSYTAHLLRSGISLIKKKIIEEAGEIALSSTDQELLNESADLVYHLLVLLRARKFSLASVVDVLNGRFKKAI